jgi:hypothetical protein
MLDVNFLNDLFVEIIESSLKVHLNISVKILLRCIRCSGVDDMCIVIAVRIVVFGVLIFAGYVCYSGLSRYNSLLGWLYCCAVHVWAVLWLILFRKRHKTDKIIHLQFQ